MDSPFRSWYGQPAPQRRSHSYNPSLFGWPVYPVDPARETRRPVYGERQSEANTGEPIYPVDPTRETLRRGYTDRQQPAEKKPGRRVVQIPVHFSGSGSSSGSERRSESALKIQKVIRGFLVRKSVRMIKEIKAQVDEIEVKLQRSDVVETIRRDEKERLRMNESLMNLLFKLDGIRGFDWGIRVCRKGATSKAVALQEKIDAMCAADSGIECDEKAEMKNEELEDGKLAMGTERSAENDAMAILEEGSQFGNSENCDHSGGMLGDSKEDCEGLTHVMQEFEKMEVVRDDAQTDGFGTVAAYEAIPSEETRSVEEISNNTDFQEDDMHAEKETYVQSHGEDDKIIVEGEGDDEMGDYVELAASDGRGEMLGGLKDERDFGELATSDNRREILGGLKDDKDENSAEVENNEETVKEVPVETDRKHRTISGTEVKVNKECDIESRYCLANSDGLGEISSDLKEEIWHGERSIDVHDEKTVELEKDRLETEFIDIPVASVVKASQETPQADESPENLDFDEKLFGAADDRGGEDTAVVENKRKGDMLEQMMEENKRMMLMITQLCERNEMQLQMLDTLTNRVDLLEKAYFCDKLRNRRKKIKKNKGAVNCLEDN